MNHIKWHLVICTKHGSFAIIHRAPFVNGSARFTNALPVYHLFTNCLCSRLYGSEHIDVGMVPPKWKVGRVYTFRNGSFDDVLTNGRF